MTIGLISCPDKKSAFGQIFYVLFEGSSCWNRLRNSVEKMPMVWAILLDQGFRGAEFLRDVTLVNRIIPGTAIGTIWAVLLACFSFVYPRRVNESE